MSKAAVSMIGDGSDPRSTRERILSVAQEQFARFGFHGVSLREILSIAGANAASGNYYFKSKHNLYLAAIEPSLSIVSDERRRLFDALDEADSSPSLAEVIRAYVAPHLRHASTSKGQNYGRIMARLGYEPPELLVELMDTRLAPNRRRWTDLLHRAVPDAEAAVLARGIAIVIAIMATSAAHFPNHVPRLAPLKAGEVRKVAAVTLAACTAAMLAVLAGWRPENE